MPSATGSGLDSAQDLTTANSTAWRRLSHLATLGALAWRRSPLNERARTRRLAPESGRGRSAARRNRACSSTSSSAAPLATASASSRLTRQVDVGSGCLHHRFFVRSLPPESLDAAPLPRHVRRHQSGTRLPRSRPRARPGRPPVQRRVSGHRQNGHRASWSWQLREGQHVRPGDFHSRELPSGLWKSAHRGHIISVR
jgi:hypothetical protein